MRQTANQNRAVGSSLFFGEILIISSNEPVRCCCQA
jgi:hypothetical protein